MSFNVSTVVSTGPSESKRDVDQPWYGLMQALGMEHVRQSRGIAEATRCLKSTGDGCWGLPLALAIGLQKKYQNCCDVLEREDVKRACCHSFLYFNLLGMSVRHLASGESKGKRQHMRKLYYLDPQRADTLYNLANLLKDEDQHRADQLYSQSLRIESMGCRMLAQLWFKFD